MPRRRTVPLLVAILLLGLSAPACAVLPMLPKIVAVVTDAIATMQVIDSAVERWMDAHPNLDPKVRARYRAAYERCVTALNAANHALAGVEKIDQQDIDTAFAEFRAAYIALRDLLVVEGIARADDTGSLTVSAASDLISLPTPEAMTYQLGR
jgi:hypothetical protein